MANKERQKAILVGPFVGELWWEIFRFAPYIFYLRRKEKKYKNTKFIIYTRPDRFDIYGRQIDTLVPLRIEKDGKRYKSNCFFMNNMPRGEYLKLVRKFHANYVNKYRIMEHIYPDVQGKNYVNKFQFPVNKMIYKYKTRKDNIKLVNEYIPTNKPLIIFASRFRKGLRRNWSHWQDFYDLVAKNKILMDKFNFVICGKEPDYVPDEKKRFLDLNFIEQTTGSSLIGLTFETIRKATLTVGSQSCIPNISLLFGIEALEWGHQNHLHTRAYNVRNTAVKYVDDPKYSIKAQIILREMVKVLRKRRLL